MKLFAFSAAGRTGLGVGRPDGRQTDVTPAFHDLLALIAGGDTALARLEALASDPKAPVVPADAVRLAPFPAPRRDIFCIGKNYREHAREFGGSGFDAGAVGGDETPAYPIVFTKATTSVAAPGVAVAAANDPYGSLDYEGELAVVIGRGGRGIAREAAFDHVFGYTLVNDLTSREAQKRHKQWVLGKGADGFCPMGPVVVTADEIGNPAALRLTTRVNGELRQDARVGDLIFDIPELVAVISAYITLLPGDIIATGTPAGVGIGFSPPRFLQPGDLVTVTVDRIGALSTPIR